MTDAHALARTITQVAMMLPTRIARSRAHLATLTATGWPSGGNGGRSSGIGDPVLSAVIARTGVPDPDLPPGHDARPGDVADWQTRTLLYVLNAINALLDSCDRTVPPPGATPADRCAGLIDPTCTELATGDPGHHGLCARCVPLACPSCRMRPAESRRRGLCEACRRAELRKGAA